MMEFTKINSYNILKKLLTIKVKKIKKINKKLLNINKKNSYFKLIIKY